MPEAERQAAVAVRSGRVHQRRSASSRLRGLLVLLLVGAGALAGCRAGPAVERSGSPAPLTGDGPEVAAVSAGKVVVIRGRQIRILPGTAGATAPAWSADGAWLAYTTSGAGAADQTWVVRADGTGAHLLAGVTAPFAWSPHGAVLAYADHAATLTVVESAPYGTTLGLVGAGSGTIDSFAWARDGAQLAYSVRPADPAGADHLFSVSTDGGHFTRWNVDDAPGTGLILAGWWAGGSGILAWTDPEHSGSRAADGLPLVSIDSSGTVTALATSLPAAGVAWSPDGDRFAVAQGGDREAWSPRTLVVCGAGQPRPSCQTLPQPPGTTSFSPAWGPAGEIAFVRAPARGAPGAGASLAAWFRTCRLWVEAADGSGARAVDGAGAGVAAPAWGGVARGRTGAVAAAAAPIEFSTGQGVATIPAAGGTPAVLGGPFPGSVGGAGSGSTENFGTIEGKEPWARVAVWAPG